MKYIIYIILIAITASVSLLYKPASQESEGQQAIIVNGRGVSQQELDKKILQQPALLGGRQNITKSLITREILIGEALRQHIDQEESFQSQLKNFYEQSLVSVLIARQTATLTYSPTVEEITAYKSMLGREITLELRLGSEELQVDVPSEAGMEQLAGLFENLSLPLRMNILFLQPGQESAPLEIFGTTYTIAIEKISPALASQGPADDEAITETITSYRKEEMFNTWLQSLRDKATVEITQNPKGVKDHE